MAEKLSVAVVGARGKLGRMVSDLLEDHPEFRLSARFSSADDWPRELARSPVELVFECTRQGLGLEHARVALEAGKRVVVGTSGVDPAQTRALDDLARSRGLGGIVVPNFSFGALHMLRLAEELARSFEAVEIVERHHATKRDAPSGTARETARRIQLARPEREVPIHSLRLPGVYAEQELVFGSAGETFTLRHAMSDPRAFAPGVLASLRYAARAEGVAYGLEAALRDTPRT